MPLSTLKIASRSSQLAKAQIEEVLKELNQHHPSISFSTIFVTTQGDKDQISSLRLLEKTNFFTKEIDDLLLANCGISAIHSAKDLPSPLPKGLTIAAITKGIDHSDSLVLKPQVSLLSLPKNPLVATSSIRREEMVKMILPHARFVDIRGTIEQRIQCLDQQQIDGVVIAEAAILRLKLIHLNRLKLPGETAPLQGQLAVVVREDDKELLSIFSCLDSRSGYTCLKSSI